MSVFGKLLSVAQATRLCRPATCLFSLVKLVALRRVAPRPAAQRLPANRAVRARRSAAARGGVIAARQPLPLNRYQLCIQGQWRLATSTFEAVRSVVFVVEKIEIRLFFGSWFFGVSIRPFRLAAHTAS